MKVTIVMEIQRVPGNTVKVIGPCNEVADPFKRLMAGEIIECTILSCARKLMAHRNLTAQTKDCIEGHYCQAQWAGGERADT